MIAIRSVIFNVVFYVVLIGMMIGGIPVMFAGEAAVKRYARLWARVSLRLLTALCDVSVEIRGIENLPPGGVIVAAKHQSFLDIIALVTVLPRYVFVLKRELTLIPLFGTFLKGTGMIPIDRSKGRGVMGELTVRVQTAVREGAQLVIFPEGTRRPVGAEPVYKSGVSHLYAAVGAPCVPVALNSGLFWPRRQFLRRPGRFILEILPPIAAGQDRTQLVGELQRRIEEVSNRLLIEGKDIRS